jgi:hypothetical protein
MRYLIINIIVLFFSANVFAYQCGRPRSFEDEYKKSNLIFLGKVINTAQVNDGIRNYRIDFEIENSWGGLAKGVTFQIHVDDLEAKVCGVPFRVGERYLVYSHGHEYFIIDECHRGVDRCTRTNFSEALKDDIKKLNELKELPGDVSQMGVEVSGFEE